MPKVKGKDSLRKRFRVTPSGKVMHNKAGRRHLMAKKDSKRRRNLRKKGELAEPMAYKVRRLMNG